MTSTPEPRLAAADHRPPSPWKGLADVFMTRGDIYALTVGVLTINAIAVGAVTDIDSRGWTVSFLNTFGISAFVWAGVYLGLSYLRADAPVRTRPLDVAALLVVLVICLMPIGTLLWVALSAFAGWLILHPARTPLLQRAGWTLLATSFPMYWSKRIFSVFSQGILQADAMLVSFITGTERTGNLVRIPGEAGYLQIAPGCSSFANVSLAFLCWVLFSQYRGLKWSPYNILWCLLVAAAVVSVNVSRIALIGFFPKWYDVIHNGEGSTIVNWLTAAITLYICHVGVESRVRSTTV